MAYYKLMNTIKRAFYLALTVSFHNKCGVDPLVLDLRIDRAVFESTGEATGYGPGPRSRSTW
jgi:hypothetical protein